MVWEKAWQLQDNECAPENNHTLMYRVIDKPCYLIWWILSDRLPGITSNCDIMAKLVCNASLLKDHDYRLKNKSFRHKICNNCELGLREDVIHMVMECPHYEDAKGEMLEMTHTNPRLYAYKVYRSIFHTSEIAQTVQWSYDHSR